MYQGPDSPRSPFSPSLPVRPGSPSRPGSPGIPSRPSRLQQVVAGEIALLLSVDRLESSCPVRACTCVQQTNIQKAVINKISIYSTITLITSIRAL